MQRIDHNTLRATADTLGQDVLAVQAASPFSHTRARAFAQLLGEPELDLSEGWKDQRQCDDVDPEDFFGILKAQRTIAQTVCGPCVVRTQCLVTAMDNEFDSVTKKTNGVAGGMAEDERRATLRSLNKQLPEEFQPRSARRTTRRK